MRLDIREFIEDDLVQIKKLLSELIGHELIDDAVKNRFEMIRKSNIDKLFIGKYDGKLVGILAFRIRENIEEVSRYGEISVIIVDQKFRRMDIGKTLMDFAELFAKKNGCKGTWLVSGFGREEEAHKFYKSIGYNVTGYRFVKLFSND